jgi:hypothetical protein
MREIRAGLVSRLFPAVLLLIIAGVHLNLYLNQEYDKIPTIGGLFLVTVILSTVLDVAVVVVPRWPVEVPVALFAAGILVGYLLTVFLPQGMFLFKEPEISYSGAVSIAAEALAVLLSAMLIVRRLSKQNVGRSAAPAH